MSEIRRILYIILGSIFVVIGVLGIVLPGIPATGPLLAAAFFYSRSSPRFYRWLMTNRWFGEYLSNYRAGLGMPLKSKITTLVILWLSIGISIYYLDKVWLDWLLLIIAIATTIHILAIKTYRRPTVADQ